MIFHLPWRLGAIILFYICCSIVALGQLELYLQGDDWNVGFKDQDTYWIDKDFPNSPVGYIDTSNGLSYLYPGSKLIFDPGEKIEFEARYKEGATVENLYTARWVVNIYNADTSVYIKNVYDAETNANTAMTSFSLTQPGDYKIVTEIRYPDGNVERELRYFTIRQFVQSPTSPTTSPSNPLIPSFEGFHGGP